MNSPNPKPPPEGWHISKAVPLGVLAVVVTQTLGAVWFASAQVKDLEVTRRDTETNRRRIELIESQRIGERISALESQMLDTKGSLLRIESKLDRLVERKN